MKKDGGQGANVKKDGEEDHEDDSWKSLPLWDPAAAAAAASDGGGGSDGGMGNARPVAHEDQASGYFGGDGTAGINGDGEAYVTAVEHMEEVSEDEVFLTASESL